MLYLLRAFRGGDFGGLAAVEGVELAFRFLIQVIIAGVNVVVFIGIAIADLFPQVSLDGVVAGLPALKKSWSGACSWRGAWRYCGAPSAW